MVYINTDYIRQGAVDPEQLFIREEVTDQVDELLSAVEGKLNGMHEVIRLESCPEVAIGPHCSKPYDCALKERCWSVLPQDHVFTLARMGKKGFRLLEDGVTGVGQIPETVKLSGIQTIQRQATMTGEPHVNHAALRAFLNKLKFPLSFLDFESMAAAIPLFDDAHPFEQTPFQYSLHFQRATDSELEHAMYLAEGNIDPRREFITRLQKVLPAEGSVLVFNASFEKGVLNRCAELFPEIAAWVEQVKLKWTPIVGPLLVGIKLCFGV